MKKSLNILTLVLAIAAGSAALSACTNTWDGAGRDVENVGEEMQD